MSLQDTDFTWQSNRIQIAWTTFIFVKHTCRVRHTVPDLKQEALFFSYQIFVLANRAKLATTTLLVFVRYLANLRVSGRVVHASLYGYGMSALGVLAHSQYRHCARQKSEQT